MRARSVAPAAALALVAWMTCANVVSGASSVAVEPTRLAIERGGSSTDITLTNRGSATVTYAVRAFAWQQNLAGGVVLRPTDDVIVYPQRLALAAGERRQIRVAYPGTLHEVEGDYRLLITELPPAADAGAGAGRPSITVRSRLSVPLFIASTAPTLVAAASDATLSARRLRFSLVAAGTSHLFVSSVTVTGSDASGTPLAREALAGWYQLPRQPRVFESPLSPGVCARVAHVVVDATFETGPPLHVSLDPARICS